MFNAAAPAPMLLLPAFGFIDPIPPPLLGILIGADDFKMGPMGAMKLFFSCSIIKLNDVGVKYSFGNKKFVKRNKKNQKLK